MQKIVSFSAKTWRETSPQLRAATGASILFLGVLAFTSLPSGCATTKSGLAQEQRIYQAATNVVADARQVVPYLPAPVSSAAETFLAIVSGLLTLWNAHQQIAIRKLKNGNGTSTAGLSPPAAQPAPTQPTS